MDRTTLFLSDLRRKVKEGQPIIIAGVGSGLTARGAIKGGADGLAVYNTAIYRIRGTPTALAFLPYDDANALTLQVAPEVISASSNVPVIIGFGAHNPHVSVDRLLDMAQSIGAAGVTNEPFIGIYGEDIKSQLNAAGFGFSREVELIEKAVSRGMLALAWVFNANEATVMAEAGAQLIGAMVGITTGGKAGGVELYSLDKSLDDINLMASAAISVRDDVIVLGHGGPLNSPEAVEQMLSRTLAVGYVTGSTGERMPVEAAVSETIKAYKNLQLKKPGS